MAPQPEREKTIAANGEIVSKPYGPSRWASPRRRPCAHDGCPVEATILARAEAHDLAEGHRRAHNCCGTHSE